MLMNSIFPKENNQSSKKKKLVILDYSPEDSIFQIPNLDFKNERLNKQTKD